ncbi:hypothetical protein ScPMuIL_017331 [Solemya velum]
MVEALHSHNDVIVSCVLHVNDDEKLLSSQPMHNNDAPDKISGKAVGRVKNIFTRSSDYPYCVFFILGNEFCERFSYYGMRVAILVLYLTRWLHFDPDAATSIFHASSMLCYFLPVIGAVLADSYLGRYRTILYLSMVYAVGSLVMALTAMPPREWYGAAVGLFLIAIGTGGIKPCVSPFGADQFKPSQEKQMNTFFSAFYFMINLGSTISIILTPILRADIDCYDNECYPLAFGIPAILMVISLVVFYVGRNSYKMIPAAGGNLIWEVMRCIGTGIKGKVTNLKSGQKQEHWLDYAESKFEPEFIDEVKTLIKVLVMFIPLPLFWTLSNQQGSRWTLQAEQMNGDMGSLGLLKPDQMQALNPVLIILLIPVFESVIYPLVSKCGIPNRPLQRMVLGLYLSSSAFVIAGLVQLKLDDANENPLADRDFGVTYINTIPCGISVKSDFFKGDIGSLKASDFIRSTSGNYSIEVTENCQHQTAKESFVFPPQTASRMFIVMDGNRPKIQQIPDIRAKPTEGHASISLFSTIDLGADKLRTNIMRADKKFNPEDGNRLNVSYLEATEFLDLDPSRYSVYVPKDVLSLGSDWLTVGSHLYFGTGARYTVLLYMSDNTSQIESAVYEGVAENSVTMFLLAPQYVLITVGEILFSITGLSFAYSQAPRSMKSVVQAAWLMTTAFGDLVVIIVAGWKFIPSQAVEFFVFAVLMFVDTVIFMIMAMFYTYNTFLNHHFEVEPEDTTSLVTASPTSPLSTPEEDDAISTTESSL